MAVRPLLPLLLLLAGIGTLIAAESQPVYYWNGDQRVELDLALDEVVVEDGKGRHSVPVAAKELRETAAHAQRLARGAEVRAVRAVLYDRGAQRSADKRRVTTGQLSLRIRPGQDLPALLARYGLQVVETVTYSPDTVICQAADQALLSAIEIANRLYEDERVVFATPLLLRQQQRRGDPNDPQYVNQWHLKNTGQLGGGAGNDLNVSPVWDFINGTGLGTGVNIAVVDDGLETTHADLSANARTDIDIDINGGDTDPNPGAGNVDDVHGTSVAGIAAARGGNGIGTSGVAPRAGLVGVRLIAASVSDAQEAQAMVHGATEASDSNRVHVSNNSWGPSDDGATLDGPGPLMRAALESGVTTGRGGLGIVYCWAGGNGGPFDIANYDGYANSRFVIAVGASHFDGTQASYSEQGTNILVNAPGGDDNNQGLVTTDRTGSPGFAAGSADFTALSDNLRGTSFSTPAVAGVVALLLEENPDLTWRDVRHVLVRTATQNHASDGGWFTNGAGRSFNRKYGFGRVNAAAAVTAAAPASWVRAPVEATQLTASESVVVGIPDNNTNGITRTRSISGPSDFRIEYVELTVSATHTWRGDLRFRLTSPDGTVSDFQRRPDDFGTSFSNWVFTSVAHWGEQPNGTWTLRVSDEAAVDTGSLTAWSLRIHGYLPHTAPTLDTVSPQRIAEGAENTVITCTGTNFAAGATRVRWNGVDLVTTVTSTTQATAVVPGVNLVTAGTATVTVATPGFDGEATQVSSGVVVTIDAPPSISSITPSSPSTPEDTPVPVTVVTADSDTASTSLTFSAMSSNPAVMTNGNLVFSGTGFTRTLTMTPVPDASGTTTVTVAVSDGLSTVTQDVVVTVTAVDDPPVAFGGRFRAQPSVQLQEVVSGFDPDGTSVTFSATDPPSADTQSFTFNTTTGAFTFTPQAGFRGMTSFTYKVFSPESAAAQVFITVAGDPNGTRPLIVSEPVDEQIAVGGTFSYTVQVDTRRYLVAPTLEFSLVGEPAGMAITPSTGAITWVVDGADRHLSFGIVVKDTITQALDTQTVVLRIVAGGATN